MRRSKRSAAMLFERGRQEKEGGEIDGKGVNHACQVERQKEVVSHKKRQKIIEDLIIYHSNETGNLQLPTTIPH